MAVADRFQDVEYVNWVKAGLALICTAEGLYGLCDVEIKKYHKSLLRKFPRLPCDVNCQVGNECSVCTTRHSNWKQEIISQVTPHAIPCWTHSDTSKWDSDPWEIAKVFTSHGEGELMAGGGDTIALVQLVLNCQLFSGCISSRQSFEEVKEIRERMFNSAGFKLTGTELKDYIKKMTTLLRDPTQLRTNDGAMQAVVKLQQIETDSFHQNHQQFLRSQRILWKQKLDSVRQVKSLTQQQLADIIGFVNAQPALTNFLETEIASLTPRMESLRSRTVEVQGGINALKRRLTAVESGGPMSEEHTTGGTNALKRRLIAVESGGPMSEEHTTDQVQYPAQQNQSVELISEMKNYAVSHQQHINEELQRLKQQFRDVHQCRIRDYLRDKRDIDKIAINSLDKMYIELHVHDSEQYKRLETRSDINTLQPQTDIGRCSLIKVDQLFSTVEDSEFAPLKILVAGQAGVGKSTFSLCLLNKWLNGQLLPAIEKVFLFSMRDLAHLGPCSLADLLFTHQGIQKPSDKMVAEYLQNMSGVMIILDGYEEIGHCSSEEESVHLDTFRKVEISELLGSIICGKTMTSAKLVLTCRSGGVREYKVFDRITEIYGFSELRIRHYVSMFCKRNAIENVDLERHILDYIDNEINIRSFCYIPMFCSLVCRIAKMKLEQHADIPLPTTVTQLLKETVVSFANQLHPDFKGKSLEEDDDVIDKIKVPLLQHSKLAKKGVSHRPMQILFAKGDIECCHLSHDIAVQCGFLKVSMEKDQHSVSRQVTPVYYFVHLIMQEFLCGIALVSQQNDIEDMVMQSTSDGNLDMILTFIAGLLGDPDSKDFLTTLGCQTCMSAGNFLRLVVSQELQHRRRDRMATVFLLLTLVFESRQPDLWVEIREFVMNGGEELNFSGRHISPIEVQALTYVMPSMQHVHVLDMTKCSINGTELVGGLRGLTKLTHLRLNRNSELNGRHVAAALATSLKELTHLEEISLAACGLNDEDVIELSPVLQTLKRLMEINLQSNSIGDMAACKVTEAVWDLPRLTFYRLNNNYLSQSCVDLVRKTVHWNTTQGQERVQLVNLDVQRLPGEELVQPDRVVYWERLVAAFERALRGLRKRPWGQREWYWGQEIANVEGLLANFQGILSQKQARRDGETGVVSLDRARQLQREHKALRQIRYYD